MSSIVTIAHGLPFFDMRRSTLVISPASTTCVRSGRRSARSMNCAMDISRRFASTDCMPESGWSDTYRPSISRSKLSLVFLSHSSTSGTLIEASPIASSSSPSPSTSANRSNWPAACLRLRSTTDSIAASCTVNRARRFGSIESKAPALISDSTSRLLSALSGTRRTKSRKLTYLPRLPLRSSMMSFTACSPTFLMAPRPKRTTSPTAEYA